jgi:hypothetical protein
LEIPWDYCRKTGIFCMIEEKLHFTLRKKSRMIYNYTLDESNPALVFPSMKHAMRYLEKTHGFKTWRKAYQNGWRNAPIAVYHGKEVRKELDTMNKLIKKYKHGGIV